MSQQTIAVTGAYGYLGSVLRARLEAAGWDTIALVRRPRDGDRAVSWSLEDDIVQPGSLAGVTALLHCAYDLRALDLETSFRINVSGTERLLSAATAAGIERTIVLSSMSAYPGSRQIYARTKLAIEELTLRAGGIAVRPGLVYGPGARGMGATLTRLTRLPVTPLLAGTSAQQFPVLESDLSLWVTHILEAETWHPEVISIAQPNPVSFRTLLCALASADGHGCRFVPIPWQLVFWTLRLCEASGARLPLRSDSLLGLVRPAPRVERSVAYPTLQEQLTSIPSGPGHVTRRS